MPKRKFSPNIAIAVILCETRPISGVGWKYCLSVYAESEIVAFLKYGSVSREDGTCLDGVF